MNQRLEQWPHLGSKVRAGLVSGIPLVVYVVLVLSLGPLQKEAINADAVCYIRRALYLTRGQFSAAISSHWSPLISWSIAPLLAMGVDGLYAARIVMCLWGAVFVALFQVLVGRMTTARWGWRLVAGVVVAVHIAAVAIHVITPDLILATGLLGYFIAVTSPGLLRRPGLQCAAGLLSGLSYLAKAFGLPFVLVHMPATFLLMALTGERGRKDPLGQRLRRAAAGWLRAMIVLLLVISPWAAALTWKYGHLTVGSAGAAAHALVGPKADQMPHYYEIVPDPYIERQENPENLYPLWSPLASRENFKHQMSVVRENSRLLLAYFEAAAPMRMALVVLGMSGLALMLGRGERWKVIWIWMTLGLMCLPFLFVFFIPRYLQAQVPPLMVLLVLVMLDRKEDGGTVVWPGVRGVGAALVLGAFLVTGAQALDRLRATPAKPVFRQIAQRMKKNQLRGPFASNSKIRGIFVACHWGEKFAGFPAEDDPALAEERLLRDGVRVVVVWNNRRVIAPGETEEPTCAPAMVERPGWREVFALGAATVYEYVGPAIRPDADHGRGTDRRGPGTGLHLERNRGE